MASDKAAPRRHVTPNRPTHLPLCADSACRDLLDVLPAAVVAADRSNAIVYANEAVSRLLGWPPEDLLGRPITVLMPRRLQPAHMAGFNRYFSTHVPRIMGRSIRLVARKRDGTEVEVELQLSPLHEDGERDLVVAILRETPVSGSVVDEARRFMAEASAVLASSLDYATTLSHIAMLSVPRMGDWCSVDMLEDGKIHNLTVAHPDAAKIELAKEMMQRYPPDPACQTGLPHVLRTGLAVLVEDLTDDALEKEARDAEHLEMLRALEMKSYICAPLVARGRVLGAITFVSSERRYTASDLILAEDLARRASIAVDNARLFQEAQAEIAERKEAQKLQSELMRQVQRSRKRADDLLGSVPGVVWESWGRPGDQEQRTDYVSDYAQTVLGYSAQEWTAEPGFWLRIVHPADRERVTNEARALFDSGQGGVQEFRWLRQDGRAVWVEAHWVVVADEFGSPIGLRGVAIDITARKQSEELQSLLAAIVESSTDAIVGKSLDGTIVSWNSGAERMFGYTAEEMIGQPISRLVPADRAADQDAIMGRIRKGDHVRHHEMVRVRKDGVHLDVSVSVSPIKDETGQIIGAASIARDITERKRAEAALLRNQTHIASLNERLQRAMTETHHRVKNNLQIIAAMVDMQVMDSHGDVPVEELQRLGMHIHMLAVVHDLLTQEAKEDAQARFISAGAILGRLLPMLQQMAGETVIESRIQDARISSKQGTSIAIVVNELVSNSVKYGAGHVLVELAIADHEARLEVADDGPGFPPNFDPQRDGGTGLELVRNLTLWDLGGAVRSENRPGGGARTVITMPLPNGADPVYPPLLTDLRPAPTSMVEPSSR